MTRKHAFFCVLAGIYLLSAGCGAFEFTLTDRNNPFARLFGVVADDKSPWVKSVHALREASGSEANHGYFSVGVGPNYRMIFILKDDKGRTWTDFLDKTGYHEADLRTAGIVDVMVNEYDEEDEDDAFKTYAKSCAGKMLYRHRQRKPVLVTILVEEGKTPKMEEYRKGERTEWKKYEEITFMKKDLQLEDQEGSDENDNDNSNNSINSNNDNDQQ
jgi:hypothetical protein